MVADGRRSMTAAPIATQEATDAAFRTLEGIAVSIEADFPISDGKGRHAYLLRQAARMRKALDAIRAELDFHDPPADPLQDVMTASPEWIEANCTGPFAAERYRK